MTFFKTFKDEPEPKKITNYSQFWEEFDRLHRDLLFWFNDMQMIHEKYGFGDPEEETDGKDK